MSPEHATATPNATILIGLNAKTVRMEMVFNVKMSKRYAGTVCPKLHGDIDAMINVNLSKRMRVALDIS